MTAEPRHELARVERREVLEPEMGAGVTAHVSCSACGEIASCGGALAEADTFQVLSWAHQVWRRHADAVTAAGIADALLGGGAAGHVLEVHDGTEWGAGVWLTCSCGERFDMPAELTDPEAAPVLRKAWVDDVAREHLRSVRS